MKTLKMPAHSLHLFVKIRFSTFFMVKRWPMNYTDFQDKDFFHFLRYIFFEDRQWRKKWKIFPQSIMGSGFSLLVMTIIIYILFCPMQEIYCKYKEWDHFLSKSTFLLAYISQPTTFFYIRTYVGQSWHLTNWICIAVIFRWVCTVPYINTM